MAETTADADGTCESVPKEAAHPEDFSKPSLSYIALIAKVLLSAPAQKLNLASIYRAMEERFPYLKSRGPGWRNSVRHNLSVNTCFVKVSRCEDGRGHYWGVHQAHLRDFQRGNFRQYRNARGRREPSFAAAPWARCFLGRFCEGPVRCAEQCWRGLPDPRSAGVGWEDTWTLGRFRFLPDSYGWAAATRGPEGQPLTCRRQSWETNDPTQKGTRGSWGGGFATPPLQLLSFPRCWCTLPAATPDLHRPLAYEGGAHSLHS